MPGLSKCVFLVLADLGSPDKGPLNRSLYLEMHVL